MKAYNHRRCYRMSRAVRNRNENPAPLICCVMFGSRRLQRRVAGTALARFVAVTHPSRQFVFLALIGQGVWGAQQARLGWCHREHNQMPSQKQTKSCSPLVRQHQERDPLQWSQRHFAHQLHSISIGIRFQLIVHLMTSWRASSLHLNLGPLLPVATHHHPMPNLCSISDSSNQACI